MNRIVVTGLAVLAVMAWMPAAAETVTESAPETSATPETSAASETVEAPDASETPSSAEATAGMAGAAVCKRGQSERLINVVTPGAEGRVCELHYAKPSEGIEPHVLWYATSDANFCNERATSLMTTLSNAGWACTAADGTPFTATATTDEEVPATEPAVIEAPAEEAPESPEPPADAPDDQ